MDIISKINWVDILVVILIARITYVALRDGLSHEIFPLIGTVMTAVISEHYYRELAIAIQGMINISAPVANLISFCVLLLIAGIIFKLISVLVNSMMKVTWHPLLEKSGGLVFGLLRASVVVSIVLMTLSLVPLSYLQTSIEGKSLTGRYLLKVVPGISNKIDWIFPAVLKK